MASEEGDDGTMGMLGMAGAALLGGLGSYKGQEDTNETNLTLGREQMGFQERMSNTSYQRAVKDMEAAGINPMLSAKLGGASTPPGSMPQVMNSIASGVAGAQQGAGLVSAAQQVMQSKAQTENVNAVTQKIRSETMEKNLNTALLAAKVKEVEAGGAKTFEEILGSRYDSQGKQMRYRADMGQPDLKGTGFAADVERRKAEAGHAVLGLDRSKAESKFYGSEYGEFNPYLKSIMEVLKGITSARSAVR